MLRRSYLRNKTPMTSSVKAEPKEGSCAWCEKPFLKLRPLQNVCNPVCAGRKARADRLAKVKAEREQTRERKAAIQTIPDLIKIAQREFNAYIRLRDSGRSCICCGQSLGAGEVGGAYDCGHYRSTGTASHLRFNERNAHAQRKHCNRYGAGRAVDYRIGLIDRIGLPAVEALESDNTPHKWTREELRSIAATYRAKLKQLKEEA